jgi:hypothetical protein
MILQKEVTIKGDVYTLTHFNGMVGLKLGKQLVKILGPSFAAASQGNVADALQTLFENLDDNSEALIIALVSGATKGNMAINFNIEFAGEYDKLFLLVKEVVEFNYGSVFQMLGSGVL